MMKAWNCCISIILIMEGLSAKPGFYQNLNKTLTLAFITYSKVFVLFLLLSSAKHFLLFHSSCVLFKASGCFSCSWDCCLSLSLKWQQAFIYVKSTTHFSVGVKSHELPVLTHSYSPANPSLLNSKYIKRQMLV